MQIGIFSGTFNPIHNGHIAVLKAVQNKLNLSKILLTPSSTPPNKADKKLLPYRQRVKMAKLAVDRYDFVDISELDNTHKEKSYTKNLILRFQESYPAEAIFFIIGADNVPDISSWYDFDWLINNVQFVAVTRSGYNYEELVRLPYFNKIIFIEMEAVNISSKAIRENIRNNESIASLVPPEVSEYIKKNRLYLTD